MAHTIETTITDAKGDVCASINYMKAMAQRPARSLCTPPPGMPELNWELESYLVQVSNARPHLSSLSIETQGFTSRRVVTAVTNFYDHEQVRMPLRARVSRCARLRCSETRRSHEQAKRRVSLSSHSLRMCI
jgi:hypothetical protein